MECALSHEHAVNPRAGYRHQAPAAKPELTDPGIELLDLCNTLTEDGRLFREDIVALTRWTDQYRRADFVGREHLIEVINRILADGVITEAERAELRPAIDKVVPAELRHASRGRAFDSGEHARGQPIESASFILAGTRYENRSELIARYAFDGDEVLLVRDPKYPHSRNAIKVRLLSGYDIGYVPEVEARVLAPLLDSNLRYRAKIKVMLPSGPTPVPLILANIYADDAVVEEVRRPNDRRGPALAFAHSTPQRAAVPVRKTNFTPLLILGALAFFFALLIVTL